PGGSRLADYSERARQRIPVGPPASVAALATAACGIENSPHSRASGAQLPRPGRLYTLRCANLYARSVRRNNYAFRGRLFRRRESVPHAIGPALQRSDGGGVRQGLLLWSDIPRGKIQDPAPLD